MNKKLGCLLVACSLFSSAHAYENKIEAFKAPFYIQKTVMACGILAEAKQVSTRHYLNLDKKYPNQTLTLLIWDNDYQAFESRFGKIENMVGKRFCGLGTVEKYKSTLQIQIKNPQFLRLMK